MSRIWDVIDRWGGIASTAELAASGVERWELDIAYMYGRVLRVLKGLWGRLDLPQAVVAAHRGGGRLACVSALAFHGVIDDVPGLPHVSAPHWVRSWRPGAPRAKVIRHWSRTTGGDRLAVSVEDAWAQFALCREVAGRDVRLRQGDSL